MKKAFTTTSARPGSSSSDLRPRHGAAGEEDQDDQRQAVGG